MNHKAIQQRSIVTLTILLFAPMIGCDRSPSNNASVASTTTAGASTSGVVTLQITGDNGTKTIEVPGVTDGATVESVLRSANGLDVVISGSGTTAFVHQIGQQATSGSEGWTFTVDGQWADKGIGSTLLHPPTTIQWKFGSMEIQETKPGESGPANPAL